LGSELVKFRSNQVEIKEVLCRAILLAEERHLRPIRLDEKRPWLPFCYIHEEKGYEKRAEGKRVKGQRGKGEQVERAVGQVKPSQPRQGKARH
jgi:hypothetical protein